jgi:hypothetical protein
MQKDPSVPEGRSKRSGALRSLSREAHAFGLDELATASNPKGSQAILKRAFRLRKAHRLNLAAEERLRRIGRRLTGQHRRKDVAVSIAAGMDQCDTFIANDFLLLQQRGQRICGVSGKTLCTTSAARSSSSMSNMARKFRRSRRSLRSRL